MLEILLVIVAIGVSTILLHHQGLGLIARYIAGRRDHRRRLILSVILGIFILHLVEIALYALTFLVAIELLRLGQLVGNVAGTDLELLYFAAETYTGLGFGDIVPEGHLRLLASFEPLNGMILLGWSASFIYVEMQRLGAPSGRG